MGYQALLFCPDEKLAAVVSQVFSELDFTVEAAHEPFAAVKRLMAQRYDAIVVDSENEQNASLLFKSARNSSFNQSSLAIALVEGQMGVAKAYRIGANLVLTKPINVEQAKGTLRVARGLLRKNSDAARSNSAASAASVSAAPAQGFAATPFQPVSRSAGAIVPPSSRPAPPKFEAPLPAANPAAISTGFPEQFPTEIATDFPGMTASAKVEETPATVAAPAAQTPSAIAAAPADGTHPGASANTFQYAVRDEAARGTGFPIPVPPATSAFSPLSGSAAAPAPAREGTTAPAQTSAKANSAVEEEPAETWRDEAHDIVHDTAPVSVPVPTFGSVDASDGPSFSALGEEDSDGSGGNKKILIAAAAILVLAAIGYMSYGKLDKSSPSAPTPPAASAPQESEPPASGPRPMSSPVATPSKTSPDRASSTQTMAPKTATALRASAGDPVVIRIGGDAEVEPKKPGPAPLVVKSTAAGAKSQSSDDSAPQLPSTVAAASTNDSNLSGLMSSASANLPKPALAVPKISQGVSQGLLIKRVEPRYPQSAFMGHTQGAVQIEATINKEGNVINPKVLSGDPVLARAALEAVRQWRYKPYYLDGAPVEIQTQITINFKSN
jgi:TonB family protein